MRLKGCVNLFSVVLLAILITPALFAKDAKYSKYTSPNVFQKNSPHYRLSTIKFNYSGILTGKIKYHYKNSKLVRTHLRRCDGEVSETFFNYDKNGVLKWSEKKMSNGLKTRTKYKYNRQRKLVAKKHVRNDGKEGFEIYKYDNRGTLKKAIYKNLNFFLNGIATFNTDKNQRVLTGNLKGMDGYNAVITFDYDPRGNLIQLKWKLDSVDKHLTYNFHYKKIK